MDGTRRHTMFATTPSMMSRHAWRSPSGITSSPESQNNGEEDMELDSPEYSLRHPAGSQSDSARLTQSCYPLRLSNAANIPPRSPELWNTGMTSTMQSISLYRCNESLLSKTTLWSSLDDSMTDSQSKCIQTSGCNGHQRRQSDNCFGHAAIDENNSTARGHLAWQVDGLKISENGLTSRSNGTGERNLLSQGSTFDAMGSDGSRLHRSASMMIYNQLSGPKRSDLCDNLPILQTVKPARCFSYSKNTTSENLAFAGEWHNVHSDVASQVQSETLHSLSRRDSLSETTLHDRSENLTTATTHAFPLHDVGSNRPNRCFCKHTLGIFIATIAIAVFFLTSQPVIPCVDTMNITALHSELALRVHGQHIAIQKVSEALEVFMKSDNTNLLIMSFHGWTGVGKNYMSGIIAGMLPQHAVHKLIIPLHFPHGNADESVAVHSWMISNVSVPACGIHLYIIDEIDKATDGFLAGLQKTISEMSDILHHSQSTRNVRAIILLLSNNGAAEINAYALAVSSSGRSRESIAYNEIHLTSDVWRGVAWAGQPLDVIAIPFLPLERHHVEMCIRSTVQLRGLDISKDTMMELLNSITYFPASNALFSQTGCRKVDYFVDLLI